MLFRSYVDGESKQYFVKRFQIETNTLDKEFGFISEGIGSRLEFVTTSDTPEIEADLVKGKGKEKETEVINLEDIIDVKGWKALGNRLSQHKVSKVRPVEDPEDSGLEEGDDENELLESASAKTSAKATETGKGSLSSKKKMEEDHQPEGQGSLFEQKATQIADQEIKKQKAKAEQVSLFGESSLQKAASKPKGQKQKTKGDKPKVFTAGQTIELEL